MKYCVVENRILNIFGVSNQTVYLSGVHNSYSTENKSFILSLVPFSLRFAY